MREIFLNNITIEECAKFAREKVYGDNNHTRMLPRGIDEESEIAKAIETQRHFIGKVSECAFLKLVEDEYEEYNKTLKKMKEYLEKHKNILDSNYIEKLKNTISKVEENLLKVNNNLECANKDLFKVYKDKTKADKYDFVVDTSDLESITIDVKSASLYFHRRLQVNNKQFDSPSLKKDYYIGAHINLRKEDCFVISEEKQIYITKSPMVNIDRNDINIVINDKSSSSITIDNIPINIDHNGIFYKSKNEIENEKISLIENVKTHVLKKPLEKALEFSGNKVSIYGYIEHENLENRKANRPEGACREIDLKELNDIDKFLKQYVFYSSGLIDEVRNIIKNRMESKCNI